MTSRTIEVPVSLSNLADGILPLLYTLGHVKHGEYIEEVELPWKVGQVPLKLTLSREEVSEDIEGIDQEKA